MPSPASPDHLHQQHRELLTAIALWYTRQRYGHTPTITDLTDMLPGRTWLEVEAEVSHLRCMGYMHPEEVRVLEGVNYA